MHAYVYETMETIMTEGTPNLHKLLLGLDWQKTFVVSWKEQNEREKTKNKKLSSYVTGNDSFIQSNEFKGDRQTNGQDWDEANVTLVSTCFFSSRHKILLSFRHR